MVAEQVTQIIDTLAEKLGVAAEKVYPMLVTQAKVFCSTYHVTLGIMIAAFLVLLIGVGLFFVANHGRYNEELEVFSLAVMAVCGLIFCITAIIALFDLNTYLTALHNPEWWAIEYVAKMLK